MATASQRSLGSPDGQLNRLWERLARISRDLNCVDAAQLDAADQAEFATMSQLCGGLVVAVLEAADAAEDDAFPLLPELQLVVDDFCDNAQTALAYCLSPPAQVIRM